MVTIWLFTWAHPEAFNKQLLRDWLVRTGFKDNVDNSIMDGGEIVGPVIPSELSRPAN